MTISNIPSFDEDLIIHWMEGIRKNPDMVNAFWASQIKSKTWLTQWVKSYLPGARRIIIFGCWYGVLADIIKHKLPDTEIICVDKDPVPIQWTKNRYESHTVRMEEYTYHYPVSAVINTSTEHMTQEEYDKWYENIPSNTYFVIQGNNDFAEPDHVRACSSLQEFNTINKVQNCLHTDKLEYQGPWDEVENKATYFDRYMTIGFKS